MKALQNRKTDKKEWRKGAGIRKKKLRGSHTAEAAILMPLALGVILFALSGCLILHDRVWLECWVYGTAQQEAFRKEQGEAEEIFGLITDSRGSVEAGKRTVRVSGDGTGRFLSMLPKALFFLQEQKLEVSVQVKCLYGEQMVRMRRKTTDGSGV